MTVFKLIEILQKYPMSMQVILRRYSDFEDFEEDSFREVEAVRMPNLAIRVTNDWLKGTRDIEEEYMKIHAKKYILIEGN